ncbi:MAG: cytochrome c4 [Candidatus Thioglobus sp.]|nr:cytochrome c4 [Candidatus Thioglobus sp.]
MTKISSIFAMIFAMIFSISGTTLASGDVAKGKAKAQTCIGCHGVGGNSVVPNFPKLAGQNQGYLLKQLQDFKSGNRFDAVMKGIVTPLTDADMNNLAAYYAQQTPINSPVKRSDDFVLGQSIYRGGKKNDGVTACIACHGPRGKGIPSANFPALSAQHSAYVIKQLKDFRQHSINEQTGDSKPSRTNDFEGVMINFIKSLTNVEINAVARYIAGLH